MKTWLIVLGAVALLVDGIAVAMAFDRELGLAGIDAGR